MRPILDLFRGTIVTIACRTAPSSLLLQHPTVGTPELPALVRLEDVREMGAGVETGLSHFPTLLQKTDWASGNRILT
jgi:hypothetical protein